MRLGIVFTCLCLVPATALGRSGSDDDFIEEERQYPNARRGESLIRGWDEDDEPAAWALRGRALVRVRASEPTRPALPEGIEDDGTVDAFELGSLRAIVSDRIDDETGYVTGRQVRVYRRARLVAEFGDSSSRFGAYVRLAGDVNGDGRQDLLVGSPSPCDCCDCSGFTDDVHVYLATRGQQRFRRATTLRGRDGMQGWIYAQPVGDVDRDGRDDVVIAHGEELRLHRGSEAGLESDGRVIHRRNGHTPDLWMQRLPAGRAGLFWIDREDWTAGMARGRHTRTRALTLPTHSSR